MPCQNGRVKADRGHVGSIRCRRKMPDGCAQSFDSLILEAPNRAFPQQRTVQNTDFCTWAELWIVHNCVTNRPAVSCPNCGPVSLTIGNRDSSEPRKLLRRSFR